jgi:hypothetical protein
VPAAGEHSEINLALGRRTRSIALRGPVPQGADHEICTQAISTSGRGCRRLVKSGIAQVLLDDLTADVVLDCLGDCILIAFERV